MAFLNHIFLRARGRYQRTLARYFGCRAATLSLPAPVVSFTFDDFPRSALHQGGAILSERGFSGTYFASLGLMGKVAPTGEIFSRADLDAFRSPSHELGCHTFDHCHSWDTSPADFEASIVRNQQAVSELLPELSLRTLSYPISCARPGTKRRTARYYSCARGGGQTFNVRKTDLNHLNAFFLEQSRNDFSAIKRVIDGNVRERGWLIFATHDVCNSPTRFGVIPAFFKQVVECAVDSGARILTVASAYQLISGISNPVCNPGAGKCAELHPGIR